MDRVLLYGFLEEVKTFTPEHIHQVIEEISGEVANHTPPPVMTEPVQPVVPAPAPVPNNPYQAMLTELSGLLDNSLQQKIRMAQQLDALLTQQHQQVLQQNPSESAESQAPSSKPD